MPAAHRIRLQGPWQVIPPGKTDEPGAASPCERKPLQSQTVQLPASWKELFGEASGIALFQRRFNRPTNLAADDHIRIRLPEGCGQVLACLLNKCPLPELSEQPLVFDATKHLQEFNQLEIRIAFTPGSTPQSAGGLWQAVLLEILSESSGAVNVVSRGS